MLSWRARRQLVVLLIITIPIAVLGFWIIPKLFPEATCFDNRKNQGEFDVDCGGPCAPCELRNPKPLTIFWARFVPVRPNTYDVAAQIENPNAVLSSSKIQYEFTLFDELGPVALRTGKTFILPQERTYIIETNLKTTREPARVDLRVLDAEWQFRKGDRPSLAVDKREYKVVEDNGRKQSVVETGIINRAVVDFREAEAQIVVFDQDGNLLGVNRVLIDNLLSGSRRVVKSIWPTELRGEVATVEVEPRVNIFDPDVILKPQ